MCYDEITVFQDSFFREHHMAPEKPKPHVFPEYCKGCGRCIEACPKGCITMGSEVNALTGLIPVLFNQDVCNGCGLCINACPEPYGLRIAGPESDYELQDPAAMYGPRHTSAAKAAAIADRTIALPPMQPLIIKGNYAAAIGALLAGCRHFFGYPITPSTEGAELMAKLLPKLDGVFFQAVSEVATVNMMYGCGGAGLRCMTFTSSPGFSLMLEGISYMIGAQVPGVFINVMRGGPGLGNIGPEQADIKLACRGLGHGNTHCLVLTPASPQEMLDLTLLSFELAFKYRNPVIVLADGYLGQMTGKVVLPDKMIKPGLAEWAVYGDESHRGNLINSIVLKETDLEQHNRNLIQKYETIAQNEQRAELFRCQDAEHLILACTTPAQMSKGAVESLRQEGLKVGLFKPLTLWPFPIKKLLEILPQLKSITVVEASNGQLEDELRLALSHAEVHQPPRIRNVRHFGGVLPQKSEICEALKAACH
jgi:pyruvate/2-oxoacid:ferredoxin oxidoreductase alpha subunit/ferredoxin